MSQKAVPFSRGSFLFRSVINSERHSGAEDALRNCSPRAYTARATRDIVFVGRSSRACMTYSAPAIQYRAQYRERTARKSRAHRVKQIALEIGNAFGLALRSGRGPPPGRHRENGRFSGTSPE